MKKTFCNHAIGTAYGDEEDRIVYSDDTHASGFEAFKFCPYCGLGVSELAEAFKGRAASYWAQWLKDHPPTPMDEAFRLDADKIMAVMKKVPSRFSALMKKSSLPEGTGFNWSGVLPSGDELRQSPDELHGGQEQEDPPG